MQFKGRLRLPEDAQTGIPVELMLDDIFVVLSSGEEFLGQWRMDDVGISRVFSNQFLLDLEGEEMVFIAADPLGFAYDGVTRIVETADRLGKRRRFRRKKGHAGEPVSDVVDSDRVDAGRAQDRRRKAEETPAVAAASAPTVFPETRDPEVARDDAVTPPTPSVAPPPLLPIYVVEPHLEPGIEAEPAVYRPLDPIPEFEIEEVDAAPAAAFSAAARETEPEIEPIAPESSFDHLPIVEEIAAVSSSADVEFAAIEPAPLPIREPDRPSPEVVDPEPLARTRGRRPDPAEVPIPDPFADVPADVVSASGTEHEPEPPTPLRRAAAAAASSIDTDGEAPAEESVGAEAVVPLDRARRERGRVGRRRRRSSESDHQHRYEQKSTVGGIIRRVCSDCGHVSFGAEDVYESWN